MKHDDKKGRWLQTGQFSITTARRFAVVGRNKAIVLVDTSNSIDLKNKGPKKEGNVVIVMQLTQNGQLLDRQLGLSTASLHHRWSQWILLATYRHFDESQEGMMTVDSPQSQMKRGSNGQPSQLRKKKDKDAKRRY